MNAIDIAIICLMATCIVIGVGEPLVRRLSYSAHDREGDSETERLLLQKEMVYGAIRDLDFDFQTKKVDQKDYTELRQQLEREAVHILRQLDTVDSLVAFDNAIEQQVLALRQQRMTTPCDSGGEPCPSCGTSREEDENFCHFCGQALRL